MALPVAGSPPNPPLRKGGLPEAPLFKGGLGGSSATTFDHTPDLESFVKLATEVGLVFTVAELEEAHKHDWAMRWLLYSKDDRQ